jgi:hypothetical protein
MEPHSHFFQMMEAIDFCGLMDIQILAEAAEAAVDLIHNLAVEQAIMLLVEVDQV